MAEERGGRENYRGLPFVTFSILNLEHAVPVRGKLEEEEDDQEEEMCFKCKGSSWGQWFCFWEGLDADK